MRRVVQLVAYITCTAYGRRLRRFSASLAIGPDAERPETRKAGCILSSKHDAGDASPLSYVLAEFLQSQCSWRAELRDGQRLLATVLLAFRDPAAAWQVTGCRGKLAALQLRVSLPLMKEQPGSPSPLSAVGLDGGDVWSGARVNRDELEELVAEATSTTINNPIIRQYFPGRRWLWLQWKSTVVRRTLPAEVRNMVLVALVCQLFRVSHRQHFFDGISYFLSILSASIHQPFIEQFIPQFSWSCTQCGEIFQSIMGHPSWHVALPRWGFLEGVEKTWRQMAAISFFLLSFFLSQSYALWRSVYIVARQVQSKINDFLLLCATYAARDSQGTYTREAEMLLDTLARYVRLWHMLLYASATRRFAPLKTPQGLNALVGAGALTSSERDRLIMSEGHDTVMGWLSHLVDKAVDDQVLCTSVTRRTNVAPIPMQIQLQQTLTELRSSYARLRDELTGRMPLSYVQLMQILTDLLIFFTPFAFLHNGVGTFGNMFATAVVTLFYASVVTLAKLFLDPLNNEFERVKEKAIDKARKEIQRIEERERKRQRRRKERSARHSFLHNMPLSIESRGGPAWNTPWNDLVEAMSSTKQKLHRLFKGQSRKTETDSEKEEKQMIREQQAKDQLIAKIMERNKRYRGDPGIAGIEVATLLQEMNFASEGWKKKLSWVPETPWREPASADQQSKTTAFEPARPQTTTPEPVAVEPVRHVVPGAADAGGAQGRGKRSTANDAHADQLKDSVTIHKLDTHVGKQTAQHRSGDDAKTTVVTAVPITTDAADRRPIFSINDDDALIEEVEPDLVAAATAAAVKAADAAERLKKGMEALDHKNTSN